MKKLIKLTTLLFLTAQVVLFTSCEKLGTGTFRIKNFTYSDCKNTNTETADTQSITLKAINENELQITQKNLVFSCCPDGKLKIDAYLSNDTIFLNEYATDNTCDCLCPYDMEYTIKNLDYGIYTFVIKKENNHYYNFKINIATNTDTTIITNPCDIGNPVGDLEWLNHILQKSFCTDVYKIDYNGNKYIGIYDCPVGADYGWVIYNCDGTEFCKLIGFTGQCNCPDDFIEKAEKTLIYHQDEPINH